MKLSYYALVVMALCSCGTPRTGILIPEGDVFRSYNYGIGVSDVKINGVVKDCGWNEVEAGSVSVSFQVGTAKLDTKATIVEGKRYVLVCDQHGYGSVAYMTCKIVEAKE